MMATRVVPIVMVILVHVSLAWCGDSESEVPLKGLVLMLKGQVTALLDRRQEDYRLMEESLKKSLEKNFELSSLRSQLDTLKKEVEGGNRQKNDHTTVQWLTTTVGELRHELTEVAAGYNVSAELQRRQETAAELGLLRGDVASFRREFEEMRAEQQRHGERLSQMQQEVATTRTQSQHTALECSELKSQLQTSQTEWAISLKNMKKMALLPKIMKTPFKKHSKVNENHVTLNTERKYRHSRDLRVQMQELGTAEQQLHADQLHLDHRMRRLEKQIKTLHYHEGISGHRDGLDARVDRLEAASKVAVKAMFNESRQMAGMDKIHQSMLELLESVESLENKVDKNVPELQREISKMEFNMAQMTSSVALLKEEQENQGATSKAIFNGIVAIEEKIGTNRAHITVMQAQILNMTSARTSQSEATDQQWLKTWLTSSETSNATAVLDRGDESKNTSCTNPVLRLVHQLGRVQQQYEKIVSQLPRDCSDVSGPSGLYLISPGVEAKPLMTYCEVDAGKEASWTVIQRRVDGTQEFNRKWSEYASGFGVPSGEYWLGNEALHHLTVDNCTTLRVDLTDIYGKLWHAEYSEFSVASASDGYRLHVAGYSGNASDALEYQNRMQFSTVDSDRDISNTHCASNYEGGWWFSHCQHANLNGKYTLGLTWFDAMRNEWIAVARSEMKVRRKVGCSTAVRTLAKT